MKWLQRAAMLALVSVASFAIVGTVDLIQRKGDSVSAKTAALQSAARAQWAQVYWQRRQARAFEAACDPAWVNE